MDESVFSLVRDGREPAGHDHLQVVGGQPPLPVVRKLGLVLDGAEDTAADHAAACLDSVEPSAERVDRQRCFASSPSPAVGKRGIVRGRSLLDEEVDADSDGNLVFKSGDTVIYTLPTDALGQLKASFAFGGSEFAASLNAKLPSVPGVDSEVSLSSDGSVTLTLKSRGLENTVTFKPDGEIEIETTMTRDSQGQSVALSVTTTLTPRPGAKEPANQPVKQRTSQPAPSTKHATATVPARTHAAGTATKPATYSPTFGYIPPIVPGPGFAQADAIDPETAQATLDYAINALFDFFAGAMNDVAQDGG